MFKRILVAVDGSPASNAGLHSALDLATDPQATRLALHVIDDGSLPIKYEKPVYPCVRHPNAVVACPDLA